MIRYALVCHRDHAFEAWFASSESYDEQAEANAVVCPDCGSAQVTKAPMAPFVAKREPRAPGPEPVERPRPYAMLRKLRDELTANFDNVGEKFPEEARKIHLEEAPRRNIHGKATLEEARELDDEGIPICPLPILPEDQN